MVDSKVIPSKVVSVDGQQARLSGSHGCIWTYLMVSGLKALEEVNWEQAGVLSSDMQA